MSRVGQAPVPIKKGVEVKILGRTVHVKGPKGTLSQEVVAGIDIAVENEEVLLTVPADSKGLSAFHGLYRALINNMVIGVSEGFKKELQLVGVGYRAAVKGNAVDLQLGFSHPMLVDIPAGIHVEVTKNTEIVVSGIDKQAIGQFAALIRAKRPPEPYKGKGVRYKDEHVRKKAGKAGK